jgi:uncharacterized membrane protein
MRKHHLSEITRRNVELVAAMEKASVEKRTRGECVADFIAAWVGSWTFLIVQSALLALWMTLNLIGIWSAWDPYPFILLNLVLSFQAAYATPILLMSQNRQARLNERRNHLDLQINLLAEQENTEQIRLLRVLCEKLGIPAKDLLDEGLEEMTAPDQIVEQIKETVETTSD